MTLHSRPASPDAVSNVETDHPHILLPNLISDFIRRGGCWRRSDNPAYSYNADRANCIPWTLKSRDRPLQVLLGLHRAFGFALVLRLAQSLTLIPFTLALGQGDLDLDA